MIFWNPSQTPPEFLAHDGSMGQRYIYLLIYHQNQPKVGKYTNSMDPMGYIYYIYTRNFAALSLYSVTIVSPFKILMALTNYIVSFAGDPGFA